MRRRLWWWPVPAQGLVSGRRGTFHQICSAGAPLAADGQCWRQGHDDVPNANEVRRCLMIGYKIEILLFLSLTCRMDVHHTVLLSNSQGHSEGSARRQGEAEADAKEPASLLLRPATGAGRGAPLDEEGRAPCCHQCEGENHKRAQLHLRSSIRGWESQRVWRLCVGMCVLWGRSGSPHRRGPAWYGHGRTGGGRKPREPEQTEPIRKASTRHWLLNTHTHTYTHTHHHHCATHSQSWTLMMHRDTYPMWLRDKLAPLETEQNSFQSRAVCHPRVCACVRALFGGLLKGSLCFC